MWSIGEALQGVQVSALSASLWACGGDHVVELGQDGVVEVEAAIAKDVHLRAGEEAEVRPGGVSPPEIFFSMSLPPRPAHRNAEPL